MFSAITNLWRDARGSVLKKEVVDALDRLLQSHADVQALAVITFLAALKSTEQEYGSINNLSNDRRRAIAKGFKNVARGAFDSNVGGGYGLFLVSAYIEASALPGRDAESALAMLTQYHRRAQAFESATLKDHQS
jgi:hypothetical protein